MRLSQLREKDDKKSSDPIKSAEVEKPSKEIIAELKNIQQEMHTTMLQADLVMRRLAQILDKY